MKVRIKTKQEMLNMGRVYGYGTALCHRDYFWTFADEIERALPEDRIIEVIPDSDTCYLAKDVGIIQDWMIAERIED